MTNEEILKRMMQKPSPEEVLISRELRFGGLEKQMQMMKEAQTMKTKSKKKKKRGC